MKTYKALVAAAVLLCMVLAGCAAQDGATASVTSVAEICGMGPVGWVDRFAGIVVARSEVEIARDQDKTVAELKVSAGDTVEAGQLLFSYEEGEAERALERAELELEQLKYNLEAHKEKKAELEKQKDKAKADQQLSYTIEIAEADASIRETEYNIATKEQDIEALKDSLENLEVTSPVAGVVQSVNEAGGTDNYGNVRPYIVITETGNRRIMGYVNESNLASVTVGMPVWAKSRMTDDTWHGVVANIDFDAASSGEENGFYGMVDETQSSSKYPFYVDLDSDEGLILGQHVYLEAEVAESDAGDAAILLPSYYLVYEEDGSAFVWAKNPMNRLEKRSVTLGVEDPMMGTVEILSGITAEDLLAFPEESLKAGMPCIEGGYGEEEEPEDTPADDMTGAVNAIGG